MPDNDLDMALVTRVKALHNKLAGIVLRNRGLEVTYKRLKKSLKWSTVSIVESRIGGKIVRIVTTNDSTFYKILNSGPANLRLPNEILGSRPTLVYGPKEPNKRTLRQTIHAEQLGINDAKRLGGRSGRIATSNPGCTDRCISLINDEFPGFKHLNPQNTIPEPNIDQSLNLETPGKAGPAGEVSSDKPGQNRLTESRSVASKGTAPEAKLAPATELNGTKLQTPSSKAVLPDDTNFRIRVSKTSTFRFVRGFVVDILVDIALGLIVDYFERKVNETTQRLIKDAWKRKVYPVVEPFLQTEIQRSLSGDQPRRYKIYIGFDWTVIMQELDESWSDVIVFLGREAAGNAGFGEVYFDLEMQPTSAPYFKATSDRMENKVVERKRDPRRDDLWRYKWRQWFLVHDPVVMNTFNEIRSGLQKSELSLQKIDAQYLSLDPSQRFAADIIRIDQYLKSYHFQRAFSEINALINNLNAHFGLGANSLVGSLRLLARHCMNVVTKTFSKLLVLDADQAMLLNTMLGTKSILSFSE